MNKQIIIFLAAFYIIIKVVSIFFFVQNNSLINALRVLINATIFIFITNWESVRAHENKIKISIFLNMKFNNYDGC